MEWEEASLYNPTPTECFRSISGRRMVKQEKEKMCNINIKIFDFFYFLNFPVAVVHQRM